MQIETFELERIQSLFENEVSINLSDSGLHPLRLNQVLRPGQLADLARTDLGYGYTHGSPSLRAAIARLYTARSADEVLVTNGSSEANFLLALATFEAGDELVLVVPNYLQIRGLARAFGVNVVEVPLRQEDGWQIDPGRLAQAIGPRTKMISLCAPNNPTGAVTAEIDMRRIVEVAKENNLLLHADEVYRGVELEGPTPPSFVDLYEKAVVTGGLSKAMAMPGLRLGWLVGSAPEIERAWVRKDYTSIAAGALSEQIALWVLELRLRREILDNNCRQLRENLGLLRSWLKQHQDLFSCVLPQATGMAFVRVHRPINSTRLVHQLRQEKDVLFLPGDVYGMDGYIRIGTGAPNAQLRTGLERLAEHVAQLPHAAT